MTLQEFLQRPTPEAWQAELDAGWPGPDGSTASTDSIFGVTIGVSSPSYAHVDLPANRHDWHYRLIRRLGLGPEFRQAADAAYRDGIIDRAAGVLFGTVRRIAEMRAWTRYWVLRSLGWIFS